jgi:hypothetical protein
MTSCSKTNPPSRRDDGHPQNHLREPAHERALERAREERTVEPDELLSYGDELAMRRRYGFCPEDVDTVSLARGVASVDREGRDPRVGSREARERARTHGVWIS